MTVTVDVLVMVLRFIVVIGVLILVHELGHFIVARLTGVGVERFSIGFGPVLLRWRGKDIYFCSTDCLHRFEARVERRPVPAEHHV